MGPLPLPDDRAKPLKGDEADGAPGPNLLSGSPPNLSYLDFLSASDRIWKALETTVANTIRISPMFAQHTRNLNPFATHS